MSKYRVYYTDGSTFDGDENNLPPEKHNVQIILERNEEEQLVTRSAGDFYILENGVWIEHDFLGLMTWLYNQGIVLFGALTSNDNFNKILQRALRDKELFDD